MGGFDLGARGGMLLRPSGGNQVLRRRRVKEFGLPWVQGEIGLPFSMDGYIRGISYQGLTIAGGGLRRSLLKPSDKPGSPHFLLAGVAHSVSHKDFSASHFGLNLVCSVTAGWATPYLGAGLDRTRVVVRAVPVLDASLVGVGVTTLESRYTAGVSLRPKTFVYLHAAYTLTHGRSGMDTGVGIRF